jgi:hypothetical protein
VGGGVLNSERAGDDMTQPKTIPLAPVLANGWLTMDTAPRDGTLIDVWLGDAIGADAEIYCSPDSRRAVDWFWWKDQFRPWGGHFAMGAILPLTIQPTHWRPRPEGPRA